MGYGGKTKEQARARQLRAEAWTMDEIAAELGVSKSSVSLWTRDVDFVPRPRRTARRRGPNKLQGRKAEEIERLRVEGVARLGRLEDQAFLAAGAALYAGEGAKRDGSVMFANSDPLMVQFFCDWLRHFFDVDESPLRARVYLHEGLDIEAAHAFWSRVMGIPVSQFGKPYRPPADPSIRNTKHEHGCAYVRYTSTSIHRAIMGIVSALLSSHAPSGVAQSAERWPVKPMVLGSSPSPGAFYSSSR
jgi:predicted transcriptional regulator